MHIGLIGASGRFGALTKELLKQKNIPFTKISREDLLTVHNFLILLNNIHEDFVILDLSLPSGTANLCSIIEQTNIELLKKIRGIIIGTTGHNEEQKKLILQASKNLPICIVSNFSRGIFLFEELLNARASNGKTIAELAKDLGFDLALTETHHKNKLDSPSGTALSLASAAQISTNQISSSRVGMVIGEHTLILSNDFEELKINHTAHSRKLFAEGAITLCKNIYNQSPKPGFILKKDFFIS